MGKGMKFIALVFLIGSSMAFPTHVSNGNAVGIISGIVAIIFCSITLMSDTEK